MKQLHEFVRFLKYCRLDLQVKSNIRTIELIDSQFINNQNYFKLNEQNTNYKVPSLVSIK